MVAKPGPGSQGRRILAIDGGGVRGIIPIEVLARLEARLAAMSGRPEARLADYFHLVAGTSCGAIIASAIALGIDLHEIRDFVLANTRTMFRRAGWRNLLSHRYDKRDLERNLRDWFGSDTTLGSERLRAIVLLVMRNASTDSAWLVSNNPRAPFNARHLDDCNLDLKLWQLARASAAAPSYFEPEVVTLGRARPYRFVFVDGGLTGFNNPAFKAFLYATTDAYGLGWPAGEDQLLVLSVGTGTWRQQSPTLTPSQMHLLYTVREAPRALILAADREQDILCRTFGRSVLGAPLDLELGDLHAARTAVEPKLFTYARINAELTAEGLATLGCPDVLPAHVGRLDGADYIDECRRVGAALAEQAITNELLEWVVSSGSRSPVQR
jgi:uncharacterized protein